MFTHIDTPLSYPLYVYPYNTPFFYCVYIKGGYYLMDSIKGNLLYNTLRKLWGYNLEVYNRKFYKDPPPEKCRRKKIIVLFPPR